MGKSTHFSKQPVYSQMIKLFVRSKILQLSREKDRERYVILLWRKCKRYQDIDMGDAYRQPLTNGHAERSDTFLKLLRACDNDQNTPHVLC